VQRPCPPVQVRRALPSNLSGMRKLAASVVLLCMLSAGIGRADDPAYDTRGPRAKVLTQGPYTALPFERQMLTSTIDGAAIEVGFWRPNVPAGTRVPILAVASPYFTEINPTATTDMSSMPIQVLVLAENYLSHGYAIAGVSLRGTGFSGGCIQYFGAKEVTDIRTAMDWLGTAGWSNGSIGVLGISYDGAGSWESAASGSPYVKTIVPASGIVNAREAFYRYGTTHLGAVNEMVYPAWGARYLGPQSPVDRARDTACEENAQAAIDMPISQTLGGADFIRYWQPRNHKPEVEQNYHGSILLPIGRADDTILPHAFIPWVDSLQARGIEVRQWIGAWGHDNPDGWYSNYHRWDWAEYLLHWLDHELKGITDYDLGPAVQVMDSAGQWRYEDNFPPHDTTDVVVRADGDGSLEATASSAADEVLVPLGGQWPYRHNSLGPNPVEDAGRSAGLDATYTSPATTEELRFSGVARLSFSVTPTSVTGTVSAYLYDVAPDGVETELAWASMNLGAAGADEIPVPLVPGQRLDRMMDFQPTDAVVAAGHQLRLRVWQVTPMTTGDLKPAPLVLHVGPNSTTAVTLPVIHRAAPRFFDPVDTWGLLY
jgi:putative CocE/NonD family hydrolase